MKPGFISPPWAHTRGDSVSALSLINRAEKNAACGCGLHYEIYHYRVLDELQNVLTKLSADDAAIFLEIAASQGFRLDASALDEARQAFNTTLVEVRKEQE
ncbi:hypothetical protein [Enterobacter roggenkampii]|uniref:hypothetical protein n=1 Tax=Enterobacter roggenkampii TaxID=1812935 RepID=UPI002003017D|nr:hypothetical protein [Enterobacter roggenkampii]MCK6942915.1 hypothetical protein [Enterobacter roggenkampii]